MLTMGAVKIDIEAKANKYSERYCLQDEGGVKRILGDYHALIGSAYQKGDFAAIDIITDLGTAIVLAGLTARECEIVRYLYLRDMKKTDTAALLGVKEKTIGVTEQRALRKIAEVYKQWDYK